MRALQRPRIEAAKMGASTHLTLDQSGGFKHLDVLRGRRERHSEGLRQLADRPLAGHELHQHAPARRVAQRVEDVA
jgi:hypothetical protein